MPKPAASRRINRTMSFSEEGSGSLLPNDLLSITCSMRRAARPLVGLSFLLFRLCVVERDDVVVADRALLHDDAVETAAHPKSPVCRVGVASGSWRRRCLEGRSWSICLSLSSYASSSSWASRVWPSLHASADMGGERSRRRRFRPWVRASSVGFRVGWGGGDNGTSRRWRGDDSSSMMGALTVESHRRTES